MTDNSQALAATLVGAVIGGVAGYLFFTDRGRALRRQLEPALDDFARELNSFRGDRPARRPASPSEGWKLLNEAIGETGRRPHALSERAPDVSVLRRATWTGELGTTNLLLGIMAAVSVLEALVHHRRGRRRLHGLPAGDGRSSTRLEARQVAPAMARVNAILDDVQGRDARR